MNEEETWENKENENVNLRKSNEMETDGSLYLSSVKNLTSMGFNKSKESQNKSV